MHIPDGYLPISITAGGYAVTAALTWYSLKKINKRKDPKAEIPKASLLTAAFIVVSLVHIPIPPLTVHLMLSGLMGILLGYYAFPAILIGISFQSVMFHHGGITTIGINTMNFGIPALLSYYLFSIIISRVRLNKRVLSITGFFTGMIGSALSVALFTLILINFIPTELDAITETQAIISLSLAHLPIILIEGAFTAFLLTYLLRVKPNIFEDM